MIYTMKYFVDPKAHINVPWNNNQLSNNQSDN